MKRVAKNLIVFAIAFALGMIGRFLGFHQRIQIDDMGMRRDTYIWGLKIFSEELSNCKQIYKNATKNSPRNDPEEAKSRSGTALIRLPYGLNWHLDLHPELERRERIINEYISGTNDYTYALSPKDGGVNRP